MKVKARTETVETQRPAAMRSPAVGEARGSSALVDKRPESVAQRNLADAVRSSPHAAAQRAQLGGMFGDPAQFKKGLPDEELLQGKFAPAQHMGPEEGKLPPQRRTTAELRNGPDQEPGRGMPHGPEKTANPAGAAEPPVAQMMTTRYQSVAADLLHREYANMFTDWSDEIDAIAGHRYPTIAEKITDMEDEVNAHRDFSYRDLSTDTLDDAGELIALAGNNDEHMYVHDGDTIHRADRTNQKLPHPALVGGDPDVTGAGTIRVARAPDRRNGNATYRVKVTNSSGHFRPPGVDDSTIEKVQEKADANTPARTTIFVDKAVV